jgi:hypothetical protein
MDIRPAPTEQQSQVIKTLYRSDYVQYGLIGLGAAVWVGFNYLPLKYQTELAKASGLALVGAGWVSQRLNSTARAGRREMGDLNDTIAQRVNLTDFEAARLPIVEKFLKGEKDLTDLPEVKTAIAAQFAAARPDMHQQVGQLLAAQQSQRVDPADLARVNVPSPALQPERYLA